MGQSFLKSVSQPSESLVAEHFRLERKHRITTITHGLANRCLTIRLSAPDVSLSFQSASHSFSTQAPRDGVMTYPIIEALRESNSSCDYYATHATVTPIGQACQPFLAVNYLPGTLARLSMVVTTLLCLVLDSNQSLRILRFMLPLTPTKHIQGERRALARVLEGLPYSHFLSHSHSLQSSTGNRDTRPACHR